MLYLQSLTVFSISDALDGFNLQFQEIIAHLMEKLFILLIVIISHGLF